MTVASLANRATARRRVGELDPGLQNALGSSLDRLEDGRAGGPDRLSAANA